MTAYRAFGDWFREAWFAPSGITQSELARRTGVSRVAIHHLLNGRMSLSATMAAKLSKELNVPDGVLRASFQRMKDDRAIRDCHG